MHTICHSSQTISDVGCWICKHLYPALYSSSLSDSSTLELYSHLKLQISEQTFKTGPHQQKICRLNYLFCHSFLVLLLPQRFVVWICEFFEIHTKIIFDQLKSTTNSMSYKIKSRRWKKKKRRETKDKSIFLPIYNKLVLQCYKASGWLTPDEKTNIDKQPLSNIWFC